MQTALVAGSSGVIGSESVEYFDRGGWRVHGVDNNMRRDFFGQHGGITWSHERLRRGTSRFGRPDLDVRDRQGLATLVAAARSTVIIHTAAQPSDDVAARRAL